MNRRRSSEIGAAENQNLNQLVENHPVGDARALTAQRMMHLSLGQKSTELFPNGLLWMYGGMAGTGTLLLAREAW